MRVMIEVVCRQAGFDKAAELAPLRFKFIM